MPDLCQRWAVETGSPRNCAISSLNTGLVAVATGLLKVGSAAVIDLFVAGVFVVGVFVSLVSVRNVFTGHSYYRRTILKKTLLEDQLGLTKPLDYRGRPTLAISTTLGQNEALQILHDPDAWLKRRHRYTSITSWTVGILILFMLANAGGIYGSIWLYRPQPTQNRPTSKTGPELRTIPPL